jgi:hypothetical protein
MILAVVVLVTVDLLVLSSIRQLTPTLSCPSPALTPALAQLEKPARVLRRQLSDGAGAGVTHVYSLMRI